MKNHVSWLKKISIKTPFFVILAALMMPLVFGCAPPRKPTLAEMYRWELSDFSNQELKEFLDKSYSPEENRRKYWVPMMESVIKAKSAGKVLKLWVPMGHLQSAIDNYSMTKEFDLQESAVYLYYWQLYNDVSTQERLYGFSKEWIKGGEGKRRTYLRKYLPALFERHKYDTGKEYASFKKMYKLVKQHDPQLVKEIFETDPFAR